MKLSPVDFGTHTALEGYGPGFFRIAGRILHGPQLVQSAGAVPWAGLEDPAPLLALAGVVDVILLGTGAELRPLPRALRRQIEATGLGIDVMTTPSACRSYNVCLAEERRVAAALVPV